MKMKQKLHQAIIRLVLWYSGFVGLCACFIPLLTNEPLYFVLRLYYPNQKPTWLNKFIRMGLLTFLIHRWNITATQCGFYGIAVLKMVLKILNRLSTIKFGIVNNKNGIKFETWLWRYRQLQILIHELNLCFSWGLGVVYIGQCLLIVLDVTISVWYTGNLIIGLAMMVIKKLIGVYRYGINKSKSICNVSNYGFRSLQYCI
jgi:hypothetical protein